MISREDMQRYVDNINAKFSVHALWNGYKIRIFKRKNLVIGGSQDWIYYHNIDVIFKKVTFFNLPESWHDTASEGEDLFRLSDHEEFNKHHPDFDPGDRHVFAFDLFFDQEDTYRKHTFFIVAATVFFERYDDPMGDGIVHYEDPLEEMGWLCKENRVITRK